MNNRLFLVIGSFLLTTGCVTMQRGLTQQVLFDSEPPGATVSFQNNTCVTPCELGVKRWFNPETVEFKLEGHEYYATEILPLEPPIPGDLAVATIIDSILIVPLFIDMGKGAFQEWPKKIVAILPKKGQGTALVKITR